MVYPVWNYGFPAILKGWIDRVFLPGREFRLVDGKVRPTLHNITKDRCRHDLWRLAFADLADGRSAAQDRQSDAAGDRKAGRTGRLSGPLRNEPFHR
jgi:hypothetical protein